MDEGCKMLFEFEGRDQLRWSIYTKIFPVGVIWVNIISKSQRSVG